MPTFVLLVLFFVLMIFLLNVLFTYFLLTCNTSFFFFLAHVRSRNIHVVLCFGFCVLFCFVFCAFSLCLCFCVGRERGSKGGRMADGRMG